MTNSEGGVRKAECRASHGRTAIVRWLLGGVLCFGGAMVSSVVAMWSAHWLERTLNATTSDREYHSILLRDHAEPIVQIHRVVSQREAITHHEGFTTLDGQPLSLEPGAEQLIRSKYISANLFNFPQYFSTSGESSRFVNDSTGPWPWSLRTSYFGVTGQQGRHSVSWFFFWPDHPGGTGYWVGYDIVTKRRVGYLGKSGLTASIPPIADQFPAWDAESRHTARIMGSDPNYYSSFVFPPSGMSSLSLNDVGSEVGVLFVTPRRDTIYVLNLTRGSVAAVRSDIPEKQLLGITARDFGHQSHPSVQSLSTELILIWSDRLEFTTPTLQSLRTVMLPEELRNQSLTFSEQDGDTFVTSNFEFPFGRRREVKSVSYPLIWFDKSGTVTRREEVTLPWNLGFEQWDAEQFQTPLSLMPISLWRYAEIARSGRIPDDDDRYFRQPDEPMTWTIWWQCLRQIVHRLPWSIGLCAFSGVPFAIACWWQQRRVAASRFERLAWPALVYLFGLVGWIAFVAHREWPRR